MNRIEQRIKQLITKREKGFIAYITAGHPTPDCFEDILLCLTESGVDIVEVGIPFSDPVGDGPVIQEAAQIALQHQTTPKRVFEWIRACRKKTEIPILLFTYYNPILVYGVSRFLSEAHQSGVDGVLCVDLPVEEADGYKREAEQNHISTVFLVAPTTTEERIPKIVQYCSGFVYYVSRLGVTGEKNDIAQDIQMHVATIKKYTHLPVMVGFGISKPEHAKMVATWSDGVIVGSALVRTLSNLYPEIGWQENFKRMVQELVVATKSIR